MADSLANILLGDTEKVKKIKSLYKREEEYADFLGPIETGILSFYHKNKNLTDAEVEKAIKNVRTNYPKGTKFFKEPLEQMILEASELAAEKKPISRHEYHLVLSYILWAISNRNWLGSKTAYLDWLVEFFGNESEGTEEDYALPFEPTPSDEKLTRKESEGFSEKGHAKYKGKHGYLLGDAPDLELKKMLLMVVSNQLRAGDPKATKEAFERLTAKGHDKKTAKEMIAAAVAEEIFSMLKNRQKFNEKRYAEKLSKIG